MQQPLNFTLLVQTIKKILRQRKISYADLAEALHLSESGVKKLMTSKDCSLQRLLEICQFLQISLSDLITITEPEEARLFEISQEQQKYFQKNRVCFNLYFLLVYEKLSVDKCAERLRLKKNELYRYLKKLDEFSLIEWRKGDKIVTGSRYSLILRKGALVEQISQEWGETALHDARVSKDGLFTVRHIQLSQESQNELQKSLREVISQFEKLGQREYALKGRDAVVPYRLVVGHAPGSFVK